MVLFVKPRGCKPDERTARADPASRSSEHSTARHVPARILQVDAIPAPSPAR